jgi:uncharacterized cupredoxin-like copper-binding protein
VLGQADASTVTVVMTDRQFRPSVRTVPAGKVTFVVRNAGTMSHEFLVLKTNKAPSALPMKGRRASEAGAKGEIEKFASGRTKRLTLTLAPGKYVLLCNLPGDYKRGQFVSLVVTPVASAPQTTEVGVSMFEMGFKLTRTTVPHGTVIFQVKNDGKLPHDFTFGSRGGGTPMLDAGQSATLTVKFPTPGKYTFICTVEGHYAAGMYGVLTVL